MIIKNAVLHIIDFNSGVCVFSQQQLDYTNSVVAEYIEKHIERLHKDGSGKNGIFKQESKFASELQKFNNEQLNFLDFSSWIANSFYDSLALADDVESMDLLVAEYTYEEDSYIGIFILPNKSAYTHQVLNEEGVIHGEIIRHFAILPGVGQRISSYAIIGLSSEKIIFADKKRSIAGHNVTVIPNVLLECTSNISQKETVKIVEKVAAQVAEEYGTNTAEAVTKVKSKVVASAEAGESFCPFDLGDEVFSESPLMKEAFEKKIEEKAIPKTVKIESQAAVKASKSHKIKTDTGIELTFPVEYFDDRKFIEFINNSDGTISIELKNIGKIINR